VRIRSVLAPVTAGAVVLAALVGMPSAQAAKAPGGVGDFTTAKNFCKSVQIVTADLDKAQAKRLKIKNTVRPTLNRFVGSKASTKPNRTQQYTEKTATGKPYQIWCKGRSVDAIKDVYGKKAAGKETFCGVALRREVNQIWKSLTPRQQRKAEYDRKDIRVKRDKVEDIGPMWALPTVPFQTVRAGTDGKLRLQAHGLLVSINNPSPGPVEFKGNHYCKLPHPDYLRTVIRKGVPAA
jgi:hypothetical protein